MTSSVTIRHNFESGHRLPPLGGKCQNLHGHSWWAEVTLEGPLEEPGIVVDFGLAKRLVREWIDEHWDHGLILGEHDQLVEVLGQHGKVYVFPGWPTVELVAQHLGRDVVPRLLYMAELIGVTCTRVRVTETHVNAATWEPGL